MTRLGKASLLMGCFLLSGLVANGQDAGQNVEPQAEYPFTEHYELGYVQPGKEQLCNVLLTDYEEYAPDRMDEYYKSNRFVQWTDGRFAQGPINLGRNDKMDWVYAPLFNDGVPYLFVRLHNFEFPYHPRDFVYDGGHSFVSVEIPFKGKRIDGIMEMDVKGGIQSHGVTSENSKAFDFFISVIGYYASVIKSEDVIKFSEQVLTREYDEENLKEIFEVGRARCGICDFDQESELNKRREYLASKKFFISLNELEKRKENFEKIKKQYPNIAEDSLLDEIVVNTPKHIMPMGFNETNFIYYEGEFYTFFRKTLPNTSVIFTFPENGDFEEVCYIGSKEKHEIKSLGSE